MARLEIDLHLIPDRFTPDLHLIPGMARVGWNPPPGKPYMLELYAAGTPRHPAVLIYT
jgi:hypothetical protein